MTTEQNPDYPISEWQAEVWDGFTLKGYWEWVEWMRVTEHAERYAVNKEEA